jgi:hypothetical protein
MAGRPGQGHERPAQLVSVFLAVPLGQRQDHKKSAAGAEAGDDDAMLARPRKAIFGFQQRAEAKVGAPAKAERTANRKQD